MILSLHSGQHCIVTCKSHNLIMGPKITYFQDTHSQEVRDFAILAKEIILSSLIIYLQIFFFSHEISPIFYSNPTCYSIWFMPVGRYWFKNIFIFTSGSQDWNGHLILSRFFNIKKAKQLRRPISHLAWHETIKKDPLVKTFNKDMPILQLHIHVLNLQVFLFWSFVEVCTWFSPRIFRC